jgi:hypothetical protein
VVVRIAKCQCGGFRATVTGEPEMINMCHCTDCQRRSGVPMTVNAYFKDENVKLEGDYKVYAREAPQGRKLHNHFCPTCGATVGWRADLRPGWFGIATGTFNDRAFPAPTVSLWEDSKYAWVTPPDGVTHFPRARSG